MLVRASYKKIVIPTNQRYLSIVKGKWCRAHEKLQVPPTRLYLAPTKLFRNFYPQAVPGHRRDGLETPPQFGHHTIKLESPSVEEKR